MRLQYKLAARLFQSKSSQFHCLSRMLAERLFPKNCFLMSRRQYLRGSFVGVMLCQLDRSMNSLYQMVESLIQSPSHDMRSTQYLMAHRKQTLKDLLRAGQCLKIDMLALCRC